MLTINETLLYTRGQHARLSDLDVLILDHDSLGVEGVDGSDSQLSHLLQPQCQDVHHDVHLFLTQPPLAYLTSLQVTLKTSLVTVFSHKDRLLSELVHVLQF